MGQDRDDAVIGQVLGRREVLVLAGTSAGAAVLAAYVPRSLVRWHAVGPSAALAGEACIVRPEQTEGPYFVDERLDRSDIRSDPSNGSVKEGLPLTITFRVQRSTADSCVPLENALVDLWHCDAAGVYSDVDDPSFNTVGQMFLRGYQLTNEEGVASFVTIFPGWYEGRTVHVHFKVRTDPAAASGFEFTSQLYFDDALIDVVHAQQPYAAKGQRTLRNAGDGIYQDGGDELLLTANDDGAGGYTAIFSITLDTDGTTSTTSTTSTTLPDDGCASIVDCQSELQGTLPDPATAASRKARRVAKRLQKRTAKVARALERAADATGRKQARAYARARAGLQRILASAEVADQRGILGVELAPVAAAVNALLALIPS
jgi:protocatechuate 3,4-dioxygenase beta subunit